MADGRGRFETYSVTVAITLVILLAWIGLSAIASGKGLSVSSYLQSGDPLATIFIVFLGPFLHQAAGLVMGNLVVWLAIGPLLESRVGSRQFLGFSMVAGYGLSVLAIVAGAATVGLSGITHAVVGRELVGQADDLRRGSPGSLVGFGVVGIVFLLQVLSLFGDGSVIAHAGGLLFGLLVGAVAATDRFDTQAVLGQFTQDLSGRESRK